MNLRLITIVDMSELFKKSLAKFGPERAYPVPSLEFSRQFCLTFTNNNYENFSVVSRLLPKHLIPHFHAVYSFCRWADDLGDETGGGEKALEYLRWWRLELSDCYKETPYHPIFVALASTIKRFRIPEQLFKDLIFAFEQDQLVLEYQTYEQLLQYCKYSANPVGRLVLLLWETYDEEKAIYSDYICTALQLANFWQDVARDFLIGRIYIPAEYRAKFNYSSEDYGNRTQNQAFESMMADLVDRTEKMFFMGSPLLSMVPKARKVDLELFMEGGLSILGKIKKTNYKVWEARPSLSKWEKMMILGKSLLKRLPLLTKS